MCRKYRRHAAKHGTEESKSKKERDTEKECLENERDFAFTFVCWQIICVITNTYMHIFPLNCSFGWLFSSSCIRWSASTTVAAATAAVVTFISTHFVSAKVFSALVHLCGTLTRARANECEQAKLYYFECCSFLKSHNKQWLCYKATFSFEFTWWIWCVRAKKREGAAAHQPAQILCVCCVKCAKTPSQSPLPLPLPKQQHTSHASSQS